MRNIGVKIVSAAIAACLTGGAAFAAASGAVINITLPESVNVGNTILPGGSYKISREPVADSESFFIFRDNKGDTAAVATAVRDASPAENQKTELTLTPSENGTVHLNKMFIQGDTTGYRFVNVK